MLASRSPPRGFSGTQQDVAATGFGVVYQSAVHSQTLPAMSSKPKPLAGKLPTGDVKTKPSSFVFCQGKWPCQVLAIK